MVFSSITFLSLFLPLTVGLYFLCRSRMARNFVLLAASLAFYAWGEPRFILVMLVTVAVNYAAGLLIERSGTQRARRGWMIAGVAVSLAFLVYFKYTGFLLRTAGSLFSLSVPFEAPVLPIGISFYTFQVLTYTVDVYRGKVGVQRSFADLLLYVSFFPQLIAGPIVNYTDIAQSLQERSHSFEDVRDGFVRFFVGLGKKVLLANACGVVVDALKGTQMSVASSWLMIVAYAFQIFFDFSGYSDMAIGLGRIFGFRFLENFDKPYLSRSVTEFWRRWHMSLGTFFREYVYIPLGGNRVSTLRHIRNILVVWGLTGLWHGASWNFIVWGLYYGLLLLWEKFLLTRVRDRVPAVLSWAGTFLAVLVGWVFFYYEDLGAALSHLSCMFGFGAAQGVDAYFVYYAKENLWVLAACVLACLPWGQMTRTLPRGIREKAIRLAPLAATLCLLLSLFVMITQSYNPFLYFRF